MNNWAVQNSLKGNQVRSMQTPESGSQVRSREILQFGKVKLVRSMDSLESEKEKEERSKEMQGFGMKEHSREMLGFEKAKKERSREKLGFGKAKKEHGREKLGFGKAKKERNTETLEFESWTQMRSKETLVALTRVCNREILGPVKENQVYNMEMLCYRKKVQICRRSPLVCSMEKQ